MRGVGLSWAKTQAKTTCRSQPSEESPAVQGERRQEAGGWAGFCWGSENRSALCQRPPALLAEEGDAARCAACSATKASEIWAQHSLVSKP